MVKLRLDFLNGSSNEEEEQREQQQLTIFYNGKVTVCDVTELQVYVFLVLSFSALISLVFFNRIFPDYGLIEKGLKCKKKKIDKM